MIKNIEGPLDNKYQDQMGGGGTGGSTSTASLTSPSAYHIFLPCCLPTPALVPLKKKWTFLIVSLKRAKKSLKKPLASCILLPHPALVRHPHPTPSSPASRSPPALILPGSRPPVPSHQMHLLFFSCDHRRTKSTK